MTDALEARASGSLVAPPAGVREWLRFRSARVAVVLTVLLWLRTVADAVVLSLTTQKHFVGISDSALRTPAADLTAKVFTLLTLAVAGAVVVARVNDLTRVGVGRLGLFVLPWLYMLARDVYTGHFDPGPALAYILVVLALAVLDPGRAVLATVGVLSGLTAVLALGFGLFLPESGILHEATGEMRVSEKALFPGAGLLQGPFTSENTLAQCLVLGLPFLLFVRPRGLAGVLGLASGLALLWSSSRGGLLTAAVVLLVGAVLLVLVRAGLPRVVQVVAIGCVAVLSLVGAVLALLPWPREAFTERGLIWRGSADAWLGQNEWFGLGTQWFARVGQTASTPLNDAAHHAHNQFLHLGVTGGLVMVVLATVWLWSVVLVSTSPHSPMQAQAALYLVAVVVCGYLEVPVGFVDRWQYFSVTLVPLAVAYFGAPMQWRWWERP